MSRTEQTLRAALLLVAWGMHVCWRCGREMRMRTGTYWDRMGEQCFRKQFDGWPDDWDVDLLFRSYGENRR